MSRPAIFFDRDGVLNNVVWRDCKPASPRSPGELDIVPAAARAISCLRRSGYAIFVVTNQPDVRRGLMTADTLTAIHARLVESLAVDDIAACQHDDRDACGCRKPKAGMLLDLAARWDIDLAASWMVGDQDRDVLCGKAAGCRTVLLDRPYNSGEGADVIADDLIEAARAILRGSGHPSRCLSSVQAS
ncbi:MAG: HAD-IIIA family hydrolase [Caulobacter sp.]|nr:HAD-IIIA family hydrolase [Caulobacter sp.]